MAFCPHLVDQFDQLHGGEGSPCSPRLDDLQDLLLSEQPVLDVLSDLTASLLHHRTVTWDDDRRSLI